VLVFSRNADECGRNMSAHIFILRGSCKKNYRDRFYLETVVSYVFWWGYRTFVILLSPPSIYLIIMRKNFIADINHETIMAFIFTPVYIVMLRMIYLK